MATLFLSAGEVSGDMHGAHLARAAAGRGQACQLERQTDAGAPAGDVVVQVAQQPAEPRVQLRRRADGEHRGVHLVETEPLGGHYPGPVGLPLLKESRLNHLGKLMFQWFYWHSLLPGRDIPGIGAAMPGAGKSPAAKTRGADQ